MQSSGFNSSPYTAKTYEDFRHKLDDYDEKAGEEELDIKRYYHFLEANKHYIGDRFIGEKLSNVIAKIPADQDKKTIEAIIAISSGAMPPLESLSKDVQGLILGSLEPKDRMVV